MSRELPLPQIVPLSDNQEQEPCLHMWHQSYCRKHGQHTPCDIRAPDSGRPLDFLSIHPIADRQGFVLPAAPGFCGIGSL